ncbi:hypothetical protein ACWI_04290 [Acetobacterium wieringae]|uniref:Uncharacterized protein n=1 Tax=Acetobacterium wieringae TaxID=52694 RepID=A0A1F2PL79_9FIRM|nr:hypothetical protein ACWI_04290 [Acetobacterium wieringae]
MIFVFVTEIFDGGQHRVGGGLTEAAQGTVFDLVTEFFEQFDITVLAFALGNPVEDFQHPGGTDPAVGTFAAGFFTGEVQEETGHVHHTGGFVHDDHPAGTHDGTGFGDFGVVNLGIQKTGGNTATGRAAHLDGFKGFVLLNPAADVKNDVVQGQAHGDLHQAAFFDLAG